MAKTFSEVFIGKNFITTFKTNLVAWVKSFVETKATDIATAEIGKLGNVMRVKGTVADKQSLPEDEGVKTGDVYFVGTEEGKYEEYIRTEDGKWEYVGVVTEQDLSAYAKVESLKDYVKTEDLYQGTGKEGTADNPADDSVLGNYVTEKILFGESGSAEAPGEDSVLNNYATTKALFGKSGSAKAPAEDGVFGKYTNNAKLFGEAGTADAPTEDSVIGKLNKRIEELEAAINSIQMATADGEDA